MCFVGLLLIRQHLVKLITLTMNAAAVEQMFTELLLSLCRIWLLHASVLWTRTRLYYAYQR